jgi:formylglycine-generating enzyme required for sulfatase activity
MFPKQSFGDVGHLFAVALAAFCFSGAAWAQSNNTAQVTVPVKAQVCVSCHDQGTKLGTPAVSVPKLVRQQSDFIFTALHDFRSGTRKNETMQAIAANLSNQDIRELADYFGGVRPQPMRPPEGMVMHKVVKQVCENCHGMTGVASLPEIPIIGGQHTDYLRAALTAFRSGERNSVVMGPIAKNLSDEDIQIAAKYYTDVANYFTPPTAKEVEQAATSALAMSGPVTIVKYKPTNPLPKAAQKKDAAKIAVSLEMITLPAGQFMMGSPADEGDAPGLPRHMVTLKSFKMAKNVVTFGQFDAFSKATGRALISDFGMKRGNYPAINTTMADAQAFIDWLNKNTGRKFKIPSESEWEYAARAGTATHYWWGDKADFGKYNSFRNEGDDVWPTTSPVGAFPPNPFGLHDMTGNVFQRVSDCRRPTYDGKPIDGSPVVGEPCVLKVMRGGSWRNLSGAARHATRSGATDLLISTSIGFRIAEDL